MQVGWCGGVYFRSEVLLVTGWYISQSLCMYACVLQLVVEIRMICRQPMKIVKRRDTEVPSHCE